MHLRKETASQYSNTQFSHRNKHIHTKLSKSSQALRTIQTHSIHKKKKLCRVLLLAFTVAVFLTYDLGQETNILSYTHLNPEVFYHYLNLTTLPEDAILP